MVDETEERVKPIILTDETGKIFTLEFNREAVVFAERRGFILEDVSTYPASKIPEFFHYAFYMHHRGITRQTTDKLLDGIGKLPDGFLERLVELYAVPLETLMSGTGKNAMVSVEM